MRSADCRGFREESIAYGIGVGHEAFVDTQFSNMICGARILSPSVIEFGAVLKHSIWHLPETWPLI